MTLRPSLLAFALTGTACHGGAAPQSPSSQQPFTMGYPTVAAALAALRTRPSVVIRTQNGWTVVSDPAELTTWSFVPPTEAAYPAVVKRRVLDTNGTVRIDMTLLCEGPPPACARLQLDSEVLNQQIRESLSRYRSSP